jgi:hypothetical protein
LTDYKLLCNSYSVAKEPAIRIAKAYAAHKADEAALRKQYGVTVAIFRGDKGETIDKIRMRAGELLGVPRGLLTFGPNRSDWLKAEMNVSLHGAAILDLSTGLRSDRNGARMFNDAQYPPRPIESYQEAQAASVQARTGYRAAKKRRAEKIWFNSKLSIKEKEALSGVPQSTLYSWFKKTTVPKGSGK